MSGMIERIARRLDPVGWQLVDAATLAGDTGLATAYRHSRYASLGKAREILEVMREPSATMPPAKNHVWRELIDAELA